MATNVDELRTSLHRARHNLDAELSRAAAGGPRDAELLASLRSMVDLLTEELRLVDPAAKRQRMNNGACSFTAGLPYPAAFSNGAMWHMQTPRAPYYHMQAMQHAAQQHAAQQHAMRGLARQHAAQQHALRGPAQQHALHGIAQQHAAQQHAAQQHIAQQRSAPHHMQNAAQQSSAPQRPHYNMRQAAQQHGAPQHPAPAPAPASKIDKNMKTAELLAMIAPGRPEQQRLQALQVLAVRTGVMVKGQQFYPRAQWPTPAKVRGLGAWGGVVVAAGIFVIQPWDWLEETLGMNKQEQ